MADETEILSPPTVCEHESHGDSPPGATYIVRVRTADGFVERRGCIHHGSSACWDMPPPVPEPIAEPVDTEPDEDPFA